MLEFDPDSTLEVQCGPLCEAFSKPENILPSQSSWGSVPHPAQQKLLKYVLDINRSKDELIVRTSKAFLTRADFWTLGLNQEMEATVGNGCFEMIGKIAQSQGKNIYIEDLYVPPTWLPPSSRDPVLPNDIQQKDVILFPLWTPGHFQLCKYCKGNMSRGMVRKKWI